MCLNVLFLPFKLEENQLSYSEVCKNKMKNNKKNIRQILKACISMRLCGFDWNLEWNVPYPRKFPHKLIKLCSSIIELQMHENGVFSVPVKCTLVGRVPALAVLGRTTQYRVSWCTFTAILYDTVLWFLGISCTFKQSKFYWGRSVWNDGNGQWEIRWGWSCRPKSNLEWLREKALINWRKYVYLSVV